MNTLDRFAGTLVCRRHANDLLVAEAGYFVDPQQGLVMVMLQQTLPTRNALRAIFPTLVYQALSEVRP